MPCRVFVLCSQEARIRLGEYEQEIASLMKRSEMFEDLALTRLNDLEEEVRADISKAPPPPPSLRDFLFSGC